MRREKKRGIKEGIAVNPEMQKPNISPKIFAKHCEGKKRITKELGKAIQMEGTEAEAVQSKWDKQRRKLEKGSTQTNSLILRSRLKS